METREPSLWATDPDFFQRCHPALFPTKNPHISTTNQQFMAMQKDETIVIQLNAK
ncbi:MAG TPA: hypothetical protein PLY80_15625 [Pseudomonadota bacterium]|nr:hypothetical protein [Pseudomonadota bacterium]